MATNEMKRVGLVFDTEGNVDFVKSMKAVQASVQANRAELKLMKSTWNEHTTAVEKATATQKYLSDQVGAYTSKVTLLRTELNDLESAETKDNVAIEKKRTELANAQASLNNYQKSLDNTTNKLKSGAAQMEDYANKTKKISENTGKVGSALTKGVTAPILATGAAAMTAWTQIDEAYDNIASKTGATGDDLDKLKKSFDNVYGNVAADSDVVSEAVAGVDQRLKLTGEELDKTSTDFVKFAEINNTDVPSSIQTTQEILSQFNMKASQSSDVLNVFTKVSQDTGVSVDDLMQNVQKNGTTFKAMGLNVQESATLLGRFEQAGIDGSSMLAGLKKAASTYAADGKSMSEGLNDLVKRLGNSKTAAKAQSEAITLFGKKNGLAFVTAAKEGKINLKWLSESLDSYKGTVENTFKNTEDPVDRAKAALHNLMLAGADLGDTIQGALAPVFETLVRLTKGLVTSLNSLDPTVKTIIVTVAGILAAIGPALLIFSKISMAISQIQFALVPLMTHVAAAGGPVGMLTSAFAALSGPMIAIIAVIAAVTAAVIYLWNTNEGFRKNVTSIIQTIGSFLSNIWNSVIKPVLDTIMLVIDDIWNSALKPLWNNFVSLVAAVVSLVAQILSAVKPIVNFFISVFGPMIAAQLSLVAVAFGTMVHIAVNLLNNSFINPIKEIIKALKTILSGIVEFITGVFTGNWRKAWSGIVKIFSGIFSGILAVAKAPLNGVIALINGCIDGVNLMIKGLNKIHLDVPDWVPGIGGKKLGFDLAKIGHVPYLAEGGLLAQGAAIVAEAGPELLTQQGNKTKVTPLTDSGGTNKTEIIDYDKLAAAVAIAMSQVQMKVDKRVLGQLVAEVSG